MDRKPSTLNLSGVVYSDYRAVRQPDGTLLPSPALGDGWVKGWVVDTPLRNIVIVAKHCGPSVHPPTNLVRVFRKAKVDLAPRMIVATDVVTYDAGKPSLSGSRHEGDITICRVNKPFPRWTKAYRFAERARSGDPVWTITPRGPSKARLVLDKAPWTFAKDRKFPIVAGDSGLPWFVLEDEEWKVVSHSTKGLSGEGPFYGHPLLLPLLRQRILALSLKSM